jgi:hypothetical protein
LGSILLPYNSPNLIVAIQCRAFPPLKPAPLWSYELVMNCGGSWRGRGRPV